MPQFRCWPGPTSAAWRTLRPHSLLRPTIRARCARSVTSSPTVRERGDAALRDLTERFDGCRLDDLRVPTAALDARPSTASPSDVRESLDYAHGEIAAYHAAQRSGGLHPRSRRHPPHRAGAYRCARAGCYVPGGRAAYPSSVLMTAVPARIAGVDEVVAVRAARPRRRGSRGDARGRGARRCRRGVPRRWRAGDRRDGLRHRVDSRGRRDRRSRQRVRGAGEARGRGRRRHRRLRRSVRGRDRRRRDRATRAGSPPTSSPRPSTVPGGAAILRHLGRRRSPTRSTARSRSCSPTRPDAPRSRRRSAPADASCSSTTSTPARAGDRRPRARAPRARVRRRREARRRSAQRRCDLRGPLRARRARRLPRRREPRAAHRAHARGSPARCGSTRSASTSHVVRRRRPPRSRASRRRSRRSRTWKASSSTPRVGARSGRSP